MTVELPTLNTELLSQIIKWAELSDEVHDPASLAPQEEILPGWGVWMQNHWITRMIIRGNGRSRNAKGQFVANIPEGFCKTGCCIAGQVALQSGWNYISDSECMERDGNVQEVSRIGREELGLTRIEAEALFAGSNEIDDIKEITNTLYQRRGLGTPYPDHAVRSSTFWDD